MKNEELKKLSTIINLLFVTIILCVFAIGLSAYISSIPVVKKIEEIGYCGTCYEEMVRMARIDTLDKKNKVESKKDSIYELGKRLWEGDCTSCHAATNEVVVGPGLKNILKRRTINWLIPFVKNSQQVIKSGDKYAVELFEKYNSAVMTSFNFKDEDIKAIFYYIQIIQSDEEEKQLVY